MKTSAVVVCLELVAFAGAAVAADYTWTGGASGDWTAPGNWDAGEGYPKAGDTAVFDADATITSDFALGGAAGTDVLTLQIAAGKTLTINASISGTGGVARKGDGTLKLMKANPFTGAFQSYPTDSKDKGHTWVYDAGAMGTASADFNMEKTGSGFYAPVHFDAGGGTMTLDIPIEFDRKGETGDAGVADVYFSNGKFVFNKSAIGPGRFGATSDTTVTEIRFKEKFSTKNWCDVSGFKSQCHVYFEKGVSVSTWYLSSSSAVYHLFGTDNKVNFASTASYGGMGQGLTIICEDEDVFKNCTSLYSFGWGVLPGYSGSFVVLNGHDQHYPPNNFKTSSLRKDGNFGFRSPADQPAQVILDGNFTADLAFNGRFEGAAGFTWKATNASREFILSNVVSSTRGAMKALGGVLRLSDGTCFSSLSDIEVGATGHFLLDADAGGYTFADQVTVEDGGVLTIPAGKLVSCYRCSYKGVPLANKKYVAGDLDAGFLVGGGTLEVNDAPICKWKGPAGGSWSVADNWEDGKVPGDGMRVQFEDGASVVLDTATAHLSQLALLNSTLTVAVGWDEIKITADDVVIGFGSTITTPGAFKTAADAPASRVWIVCENLTVDQGAKIDVTGKGWAGGKSGVAGLCGISGAGFGPGAAINANFGSSHGGMGAVYDLASGFDNNAGIDRGRFGYVYDDPYAPTLPGSGAFGAGEELAGGGAVKIEATGEVKVNGSILASASTKSNDDCRGSGGSVWIQCATFSGSGEVLADGGSSQYGFYPGYLVFYTEGNKYAGGPRVGGGGMIRVESDAVGSLDGMRISAAPGYFFGESSGYGKLTAVNCDKYRVEGDLGTLTFKNNLILDALLGKGLSGRLVGVTNYTCASSLDWTWGHVRFAGEGATVTFDGDLTISGEDSRLEIGGVETRVEDRLLLRPNRFGGKKLNSCCVKGNLTLNGGAFDIRAAETNAVNGLAWGGAVTVDGDLTVGAGGYLYPWSDPISLGVPHFTVGGAFEVAAGGTVSADGRGGAACGGGGGWTSSTKKGTNERGWLGDNNMSYGLGTSGGRGAAHGGVGGGGWKQTEGQEGAIDGGGSTVIVNDEWTADHAGAGGGSSGYGAGGLGGGLVYVEAKGLVLVDGTVSANGRNCDNSSGGSTKLDFYAMMGAGAGGAVYLSGASFAGSGTVTANGGDGVSSKVAGTGAAVGQTFYYSSGAGGGGRVVIRTGADVEGKTKLLKDTSGDWKSDPTVQKLVSFTGTVEANGGHDIWWNTWQTGEPPQFEQTYGGDGTVRFLRDIPAPGVLLFIR